MGHRGALSSAQLLESATLAEFVRRGPRINGRPHIQFPNSGLTGIIFRRYVEAAGVNRRSGKVYPPATIYTSKWFRQSL